ncbi:MAG: hypothetical protein AVDCRST_MAG58-3405, partial [uncultured Rubrobacteraceae bacterium]
VYRIDRSLVQNRREGPGPRTTRARARVGRVGFTAHMRGGFCDGGSRDGFLLHHRGRLAGPAGRSGPQERPRRRMLLYAHLARHSGGSRRREL